MESDQLVRELIGPWRRGTGWLTFLGVVSIVYGGFIALSIIGLIVAWIPIWIGVVLIQAGSALKQARNGGDTVAMIRAMAKLKTYFTIWGVVVLILLLLWLPLMLLGFSMGFFSSFGGWHSLEQWPTHHIGIQRRTDAGAVHRFKVGPASIAAYGPDGRAVLRDER